MSVTKFQELEQLLSEYGQEHILQFWDSMSDDEREGLYQELIEYKLDIDFNFAFKRQNVIISHVMVQTG